jgi:VanZ family protein
MASLSKSASTNSRWLPLLAWIAVIFLFSTDTFADARTSGVIIPVLHWLFPGLTPEQLELGHAICRKAGHVFEFFVLGILAWRARAEWIFSMALILLVAITDEFHQSFVPSRTSSIMDVGYDLAGGIGALWVVSRLRRKIGARPLVSLFPASR